MCRALIASGAVLAVSSGSAFAQSSLLLPLGPSLLVNSFNGPDWIGDVARTLLHVSFPLYVPINLI